MKALSNRMLVRVGLVLGAVVTGALSIARWIMTAIGGTTLLADAEYAATLPGKFLAWLIGADAWVFPALTLASLAGLLLVALLDERRAQNYEQFTGDARQGAQFAKDSIRFGEVRKAISTLSKGIPELRSLWDGMAELDPLGPAGTMAFAMQKDKVQRVIIQIDEVLSAPGMEAKLEKIRPKPILDSAPGEQGLPDGFVVQLRQAWAETNNRIRRGGQAQQILRDEYEQLASRLGKEIEPQSGARSLPHLRLSDAAHSWLRESAR